MKESFGHNTRRSHERNLRVVIFWCAFVFAFVIAGVWLFRGAPAMTNAKTNAHQNITTRWLRL